MMRFCAAFTLSIVLAACSSNGTGESSSHGSGSNGTGATSDQPSIHADATWNDGQLITVPSVIEAGTTITIAPGATIKMVDGVTITVKGTLKSATGGGQAKLTGNTWVGIVVAAGGTLALDGVDIENATAAIDVQANAASAKYDRGTISGSLAPFVVEPSGALTSSHATVVGSKGTSHILGSFKASYLDYDANGFDGITTANDDAELWIEDSKLHGGGGESDMVVSYTGAKSIHVAYTDINKVHCAFHMERVTNLDVSYVTASGDSYGFMMYGSLKEGTRTVTKSNFVSNYEWGIHEQDDSVNGVMTVDGCYFNGNGTGDVHLHTASSIVVENDATTLVPGAGPR